MLKHSVQHRSLITAERRRSINKKMAVQATRHIYKARNLYYIAWFCKYPGMPLYPEGRFTPDDPTVPLLCGSRCSNQCFVVLSSVTSFSLSAAGRRLRGLCPLYRHRPSLHYHLPHRRLLLLLLPHVRELRRKATAEARP